MPAADNFEPIQRHGTDFDVGGQGPPIALATPNDDLTIGTPRSKGVLIGLDGCDIMQPKADTVDGSEIRATSWGW